MTVKRKITRMVEYHGRRLPCACHCVTSLCGRCAVRVQSFWKNRTQCASCLLQVQCERLCAAEQYSACHDGNVHALADDVAGSHDIDASVRKPFDCSFSFRARHISVYDSRSVSCIGEFT